jgi:hypothetical protein
MQFNYSYFGSAILLETKTNVPYHKQIKNRWQDSEEAYHSQ